MNDWEIGGTQNRWVCPSDRHLQLRAQLKSGWSVRTASARSPTNAKQSTASASGSGVSGGAAGGPSASSSSTLNGGLSEAEQEHIRKVLERAENGRQNEELRIGKMVDRLDKLRSRATGNGVTQCLLCQTEFGLLASKSYAAMCLNCRKYVCQKNCGVETFDQKRGEPIFLCKICSEYREVMWKKSGAWFYREMPNFTRPSMFDGGSSNNNDALCNGGGGALPSPSAFGGAFPYSGSANRRYTPTAADSPCSSAGGSPTASHVPSLRTVRGGGIFSYGGAVNVGMGGDAATIHRSGSRGGGIPDVSSPSRSGANSRSGRGGCDGFGDTFPQAFFPLCNASQQQQQQHQRRSGSGSGSQRGSGGSVGTPTTSMPTGHFIQHQQSGSRQLPIPPDHQQRLKTTPRPRITPSWVHEKVQSSISVGSDCEEDDEEEEDEDDEDAIDDIDELDEFGDADEMDTNNGGSTGRQGGRAATANKSGSATQLSGGGSCAIRAAPSPSSSSSSMSRTAEFPLKQGGGGPTTTSNLSAQNVSGQNQAHSQYSSPHQSNNNQRFQQMTLHEGVGGSFPHLPGSSSGGTTSLGRGRASGGPSSNHHYHHHHNQQTGTISPNAPHHHHHHRQQQHHRSDHELNRCISCEDDAHHQLSAALTSRSYAGVDGGLRSVRRYTARNRSRITDTEDSENDESRRTTPSTSPRHSVATPSSYGGEDVVSSSSQQISSAAVSDQLSSSGGATTPGHVIGGCGGGGASAGSIIAATLTNDAASDSKSIDSGVVQSDHSVHQTSQGFVSSVDQQQTAMIPIASATTPSNVASNYPSHHQSRLVTTVNNAMPYYTTAPPPPIPPRSATVGMPPHPRSAIITGAAAAGVATFASSNDRRHSVAPTPSAARPSSVSPSPTNHSLLLSNPYSNNNNSNNNANNKYNGQRSRLDVSSHESLQSLGTGRKFLQHNADGGTPSTSSTMRQDSESTRRTSGAGSASMSSRRESAHSSSDFLVASMSGECHESAVVNCANALKDDEVEEEPSFMSSPDDNDDPNSLGSIQFNLTYLPEEQQLVVHLIRAKNLKAMDKNGFSDPYVKLHLIPGNAKATKLTSKTIEKTLNPEWHEELIYYGVTEDERQRKSLRFTVLDRDRIGSDFLGETRVALKSLPSGSTKKFHLYLEHAMPIPAEKSEELERGKILVSICYNIQQASLFVNIKRCAELLGMDSTGFSDPYCKVSLTPLASKAHRQKTSIKKRTLNPEFKSVLQFIVPFKDLPKKTLEIGVYDYDVGRHDDYIGGILLSTTAKDLRGKQWRDCIQNPGKTFEYWHRLELDT